MDNTKIDDRMIKRTEIAKLFYNETKWRTMKKWDTVTWLGGK